MRKNETAFSNYDAGKRCKTPQGLFFQVSISFFERKITLSLRVVLRLRIERARWKKVSRKGCMQNTPSSTEVQRERGGGEGLDRTNQPHDPEVPIPRRQTHFPPVLELVVNGTAALLRFDYVLLMIAAPGLNKHLPIKDSANLGCRGVCRSVPWL